MKRSVEVIICTVIVMYTYTSGGATNCDSKTQYPYKTNIGADNYDSGTLATPGIAQFASGVGGFFSIGSLSPTSYEKYRSEWVVCCIDDNDTSEKAWKLNYTSVTAGFSVTPGVGASCAGPVQNIVDAINGAQLNFTAEAWATFSSQISGMGISGVSAMLAYSIDGYKPETRVDECGFPGEEYTAPFIGLEKMVLTCSGPSYSGLHLEFTTVAGSIEYQKLGYVSGGWVITLASYANVGSSLRLGENGTLQQYPVSQLTFSNPPSNSSSGSYIQSDIYDYD